MEPSQVVVEVFGAAPGAQEGLDPLMQAVDGLDVQFAAHPLARRLVQCLVGDLHPVGTARQGGATISDQQGVFAEARVQDALFHPSGDWNAFDGLPLPVCKYARSRRDKRFRDEAAWSVCAAKREKYYGFKAGVLMNSAGEIFRWWPANTDEREMPNASSMSGLLFADKGMISADFS
jgi:hypothetical protein